MADHKNSTEETLEVVGDAVDQMKSRVILHFQSVPPEEEKVVLRLAARHNLAVMRTASSGWFRFKCVWADAQAMLSDLELPRVMHPLIANDNS